jgi:hypothetical protein
MLEEDPNYRASLEDIICSPWLTYLEGMEGKQRVDPKLLTLLIFFKISKGLIPSN